MRVALSRFSATGVTLAACLAATTVVAEAPVPQAHAADKAAAAPDAHADHGAMKHGGGSACSDARVACGAAVTPAFGKDGRLFVVFPVGKTVYVAASADSGKTFDAPVTIATVADGVIDANGDGRPKIVALNDGSLLVSYTSRPDKVMIGTIFTARSTDGGKTFSAPQSILNEGGQRFESFVVNKKGRLYAAWLDKTNLLKAKAEGREFLGSGVAFGYSDDGGQTFKGKTILVDHACECCRTSAALDKDGLPVFAWRQVLDGNIRDHFVAKLDANASKATTTRVSNDEWTVNSCPHHGPSLAVDNTGWHVAWFTKSKTRQGLYYAQSRDGGKSFGEPQKFGDDAKAPAHPTLLATKGRLYRVWKEFDGATTTIPMQMSRDGGKSWSAPRVMAETTDASDLPELIAHRNTAYVSWLTHKDGYRLLPLPRDEKSAAR